MGYVYLITNGYVHYKIGITSKTIGRRMRQLQTGNSEKIQLVKSYKSENYREIESWLHRKFGNKRLQGEWFELDDVNVIDFEKICKSIDGTITLLKKENPFFK
jgi:hypothetical protein